MADDATAKMKPATVAAQALGWIEERTRAVSPPVHTSSTFIRDPANAYRSGRVYAPADNPTWEITDLAAVGAIAHDAGARFAVDSTVGTPVFTRPLDLGADIVMHSATKYLNGHSDLIGGVLATRADDEAWSRIKTLRVQ